MPDGRRWSPDKRIARAGRLTRVAAVRALSRHRRPMARKRSLDPRISIATVYRTVRLFEEKGILQRRDFGSGRARYEPTKHGPHYHLIDVETGKVVEFKNSEHERLIRALAEQLGFQVVSLRLEVFGRRLDAQPAPGQLENGADPRAR